jgi:thiosulfate/3-mercaptopyruvate sulfurtransferase
MVELVVVLSVSSAAAECASQHRTYDRGHLPGAVRLDWLRDLQHPSRPTFSIARRSEKLMDANAITADSQVVLDGNRCNTRAAAACWCFAHYAIKSSASSTATALHGMADGLPLSTVARGRSATTGPAGSGTQ